MSQLIKHSSTCFLALMIAPAILADDATKTTTTDDESPAPLSVAPLDHIVYPSDRPEWVKKTTDFDAKSHKIVVVSGPSDTREKSLEELNLMARVAVSAYITRITDSGGYEQDFYSISDYEIDNDLVVRRYEGTLTQGDTTMYEDAIELVFTEAKRDEIKSAFANVAVRERLGALGVLLFGGLVMLMCSSAVVGVVSRRVERQDSAQAV